tara:strand:- start:259 stop:435 length:177 start_codon:yes stop_codon:yes gene_type:complete
MIESDEYISDTDLELIQSFGNALIDRDEVLMREILDIVYDRMSSNFEDELNESLAQTR